MDYLAGNVQLVIAIFEKNLVNNFVNNFVNKLVKIQIIKKNF